MLQEEDSHPVDRQTVIQVETVEWAEAARVAVDEEWDEAVREDSEDAVVLVIEVAWAEEAVVAVWVEEEVRVVVSEVDAEVQASVGVVPEDQVVLDKRGHQVSLVDKEEVRELSDRDLKTDKGPMDSDKEVNNLTHRNMAAKVVTTSTEVGHRVVMKLADTQHKIPIPAQVTEVAVITPPVIPRRAAISTADTIPVHRVDTAVRVTTTGVEDIHNKEAMVVVVVDGSFPRPRDQVNNKGHHKNEFH